MVRTLLLLLITNTPLFILSQELPQVDGKVVYNYQTTKEGVDKTALYAMAERFLEDVIKKENVVIQSSNPDSGQLIAKGISAFTNHAKKGWTWTVGIATRPQFVMQFDIKDEFASLTIKNIMLSTLYVDEEIYLPIEDDMVREKRKIQSLKGKLKEKRTKEYNKNADMINDHFYSILVLFKRELDKL